MPESRHRPGHQYQKPSDIPARQRTKGRILWSLLLGVFGLLIAFFAAGGSYVALAIGFIIGGAIGYRVGKAMEADAKKRLN